MGLGQYNGQGVYCGLSTVSEVFLFFNTQLYTYSWNYNAISFTSLQEGSIIIRNTGRVPEEKFTHRGSHFSPNPEGKVRNDAQGE